MTGHRNTAEVETLTAEVRVLMVGSRQITQSVAAQLDEVAPDVLNPVFGRVKIRGVLFAIGSNSEGALALARRCGSTGAAYPWCDECQIHWNNCDVQDHYSAWDGNGNTQRCCLTRIKCKYQYGWLDSLPLIVLAGLR